MLAEGNVITVWVGFDNEMSGDINKASLVTKSGGCIFDNDYRGVPDNHQSILTVRNIFNAISVK
jgi:hypothetical protein